MSSYAAVHARIRRERGSASAYPCADGCGRQAKDWAYVGLRAGVLPFEPNLDAYVPLCRRCHRRRDDSTRRARLRAGAGQDFLF